MSREQSIGRRRKQQVPTLSEFNELADRLPPEARRIMRAGRHYGLTFGAYAFGLMHFPVEYRVWHAKMVELGILAADHTPRSPIEEHDSV